MNGLVRKYPTFIEDYILYRENEVGYCLLILIEYHPTKRINMMLLLRTLRVLGHAFRGFFCMSSNAIRILEF